VSRHVAGCRSWDTRREREQAVTVNIAPDLMPLWERVRWQFKGTPQERLEAFTRYVEEHPDEVTRELQAAAERKLDACLDELDDRAEVDAVDDGPAPFDSGPDPAEEVIVRLHAYARTLQADVLYWKTKALARGGTK
jgi:hypothetical protein